MAFDREAAIAAGYSAAEIDAYLANQGGQPQPASVPANVGTTPGKTPAVREPPVANPTFLQDVGQSALPELTRGVVGMMTAPRSISDLLGASPPGGPMGWPTYDKAIEKVEQHYPGDFSKPQTVGGKFVGTALQMAPGMAIGPGGWTPKLLQWLGSSVGSEGAAQLAEKFGGAGPWSEAVARGVGGLVGASPMAVARKLVTPNPYDPKAYAALLKNESNLAANTRLPLSPKMTGGANSIIDESHPQTIAVNQFRDEEKRVSKGRGGVPTGQFMAAALPPAATNAPRQSMSGEAFLAMQDALRKEIARTTSSSPQRANLQSYSKALDDLADFSTTGTPQQGAWSVARGQRGALEQGVEDAANKGSGTIPWLATLAGAGLGHYGGAKYGLGPIAGAGVGHLAGNIANRMLPSKVSLQTMFPAYGRYLRNQNWQPGDLTGIKKAQLAAELASGELVLPPLVTPPPTQ